MILIQKIVGMPFSIRQQRLAKERGQLSKLDFVKRVADAGGDQEAAHLIYEKLIEWCYAEEFTPYPEDDLEKIYGIAEEELDEDMILDILGNIGVQPPTIERMEVFGKIVTPLDVARFVKSARFAMP